MDPVAFLNIKVGNNLGARITEGMKFGIELELEGRGVGLADVATRGWNRHQDGSLRGESVEFSTAGGKGFDESKKLVTELFKKLKDNKVRFNDSIRTSTHVHLNFSDKTFKQVINFFTLFTLLEEVLQYYSGEDRKGNLFCISSREAAGIITEVTRAVERGSFERFIGDRYKYAACNLSSLYKFGTVEIRTMKGATSDEQVINWLSILNDMYVYACEKMVSPAKLVSDLSFLGAEGFMKSIFSAANYRELMKTFPVIANLHLSLLEGARLLQVFAYSFEDEFVAKVEKRPAKAKAGGAVLPYLFAMPGRGLHTPYAIYRPDGGAWICHKRGAGAGDFWEDGDRLEDCPAIQWSGRLQRFVWIKRNGDIVACRWRSHHELRDEGPPAERHPDFARAVARAARREEEEDEEFEMDEEDRF